MDNEHASHHLIPSPTGHSPPLPGKQAYECWLPCNGPTMMCASTLKCLLLRTQRADTALLRMLATMMPRLETLAVETLEPGQDLSHFTVEWQEVEVTRGVLLQQVVWLPRGIRRLWVWGDDEFVFVHQEGDSLWHTCALLRAAWELLSQSPEWSTDPRRGSRTVRIRVELEACPAFAASGPGAHATSVAGQQVGQGSPWSTLFEALSPLQPFLRQEGLGLVLNRTCTLSADVAVQGARWMPGTRHISAQVEAPGFRKFVEALGESAWLDCLSLFGPWADCLSCSNPFPWSSERAQDKTFKALRRAVAKRAASGRGLTVDTGECFTDEQCEALSQAAASK